MTLPDIPLDLQVWKAEQAAAYLGESKEHFLRETRFVATFPAVLKEFQTGRPRWAAKAVIAWALRS